MPSRYYSEFPERKISAGSPPKKDSRGSAAVPAMPMRTANWAKPGPTRKGSFNAKTKVPVVRTRPAKHGID